MNLCPARPRVLSVVLAALVAVSCRGDPLDPDRELPLKGVAVVGTLLTDLGARVDFLEHHPFHYGVRSDWEKECASGEWENVNFSTLPRDDEGRYRTVAGVVGVAGPFTPDTVCLRVRTNTPPNSPWIADTVVVGRVGLRAEPPYDSVEAHPVLRRRYGVRIVGTARPPDGGYQPFRVMPWHEVEGCDTGTWTVGESSGNLGQGRYITNIQVNPPPAQPRPDSACVRVTLDTPEDSPWRPDTVDLGKVPVGWAPLDSVRVDFVLEEKSEG